MKVKIPLEWTESTRKLDYAIDVLKCLKKFKQGKVVLSTSGFSNKIKYYLLGYIQISDVEAVCEEFRVTL